MIHCHDDKECVILDQIKFLNHTYTHTKNWRQSVEADSIRSLTWRKDLFYVEQPFRRTNNEQMAKKKKKKKKNDNNTNAKRSHDEAFDDTQNDLISKLNEAANFCKDKLSFIHDTSLIQTEHSFNDIPFAEIATQQNDRIPPIQQILLTDYFLRASKLGIQTNLLYTHDKPHASIIDTAIAGQIVLPEKCRFLWADMKNMKLLVNDGRKYSFIVVDPPWLNKSVRRKRPYHWSDFDDIKNLPVENLIDRTHSSLICCWSTNCDRIEDFIKNDLFKKWNCQYLTTWYWLKVTRSGEAVLDLTSTDKKSYETLILGYTDNDDRFDTLKNTTKIICSVFNIFLSFFFSNQRFI
ncbi:hypothetical protein I4U23_018122 [Adineta vaga]|nr:hypothetical protein I4U23_018122 [Adineta vaga]